MKFKLNTRHALFKGENSQGWQVQFARNFYLYPLVKKPNRIGYRKSRIERMAAEIDKKTRLYDRLAQNSDLLSRFPKGRLRHLNNQIEDLEIYLGILTTEEEYGRQREAARRIRVACVINHEP